MKYSLHPINNKEMLQQLDFSINRGNYLTHLAEADSKLNKFTNKEPSEEFLLPIPKDKIKLIPNVEVYLIHIIK